MDYRSRINKLATLAGMRNPVRLVLFSSDTGCPACPAAKELVQAVKACSSRIGLETYDMVMDRDKREQYGIKRVPAMVVEGADGRAVTFYGLVDDILLELFLDAIKAASVNGAWFPENVSRVLKRLSREVHIQVLAENSCSQCGLVARTAIGLGFESNLIYTDVVVADDFPDLMKKHAVAGLPRTIFGENQYLDGHVTESEFIENIFTAEGLTPAPDRRCLVCGTASPDIVCSSCKLRIQSEALEHKRKGERMKQSETP